jgi:hypothetical protein
MTYATTNEKMWTDDIRQIVALFQSRLHFGEVIKNPIDYLKALKPELRAAGPELEFLQLAVPEKNSPFGWKPTPRLMELIAEPNNRKKSRRLYEADAMWGLLGDYAFGYGNDGGKTSVFTRELLLAVGLVQEYGDSDWVTVDLHNLFNSGYYDKREKDGLPPFEHCSVRISAYGRTLLQKLENRS